MNPGNFMKLRLKQNDLGKIIELIFNQCLVIKIMLAIIP